MSNKKEKEYNGWRKVVLCELGVMLATKAKGNPKENDYWRNRIVGEGEEAPDQLLANPRNWRIHAKYQQDALATVLDKVGWVQRVVVNQRTGFVVDGHLRVAMAISHNELTVPVVYVDLSPEEEALILASLDPIAAMAGADKEKLAELLEEVRASDASLQALVEQISGNQVLASLYAEPPNWRDMTDVSRVGDESIEDLFGHNGGSVWPRTGDEQTPAAPYYVSLPVNPSHVGDRTPGKESILQRYSRSPFREMYFIVKAYLRPGERFLEVCAGWWTFSTMAACMGYSGAGIDMWDVSIAFGQRQLSVLPPNSGSVEIFQGDARAMPFSDREFDFIYCNPPFFQLESYGGLPGDLGGMTSFAEWKEQSILMLQEMRRVVKPGSLIVTVMANYRHQGMLVPLHSDWISMGIEAGLILQDIAIRHLISQTVMLFRRAWEKRHCPKAHEYIIVFKAPN